MSSQPKELLGPDGKPVPGVLCVEVNGQKYPYRVVGEQIINENNHKLVDLAILTQCGDQFNMILLMFYSLAKDLYSRQPEGSKCFLDIAKQLNINILDKARQELDVAKELEKIVGS